MLGKTPIAALLLLAIPCSAARLGSPARQAFDNYSALIEKRLAQQHANPSSYLAVLNRADGEDRPADAMNLGRQLRSGAVRIESVNGGTREVPGGLIHHWRGVAFVPGATAADMLALLRDYNHLPTHYSPEIESARVVSDHGGQATIAVRMKKQKVVTIVLDTQYDVQSGMTSPGSGYSFSRSTHVWEVEGAGTKRERRLPEGDDDGFLWRLNSYWSFVEIPGGLLIECEAVSLTRDVPAGLGWLVTPLLQDMPRESMTFTINATRTALAARAQQGTHL